MVHYTCYSAQSRSHRSPNRQETERPRATCKNLGHPSPHSNTLLCDRATAAPGRTAKALANDREPPATHAGRGAGGDHLPQLVVHSFEGYSLLHFLLRREKRKRRIRVQGCKALSTTCARTICSVTCRSLTSRSRSDPVCHARTRRSYSMPSKSKHKANVQEACRPLASDWQRKEDRVGDSGRRCVASVHSHSAALIPATESKGGKGGRKSLRTLRGHVRYGSILRGLKC